MKFIFLICILTLYLFTGANSFATNENYDHLHTPNTDANIARAELLEKHIENFSGNIRGIAGKYGVGDDSVIQNTLRLTDKMLRDIELLKTRNKEKSEVDKELKKIVGDLDLLNKGIKLHLKEKIEEVEVYHSRYAVAGDKIAAEIEGLARALQNRMKNSHWSDTKKDQIRGSIQNLQKIAHILERFETLEFYKKTEIRASFLRLIKDIKKELQYLRSL